MPDDKQVADDRPKLFVGFVLELEEAEHTWGAVKAVFDSCVSMRRPAKEYAPLARAMVTMAEAIDKKRASV